MNYKKHYDLLINRAKNRLLESSEYKEKHHIIPRCMGGDDSPDNLVELTPEEHYVAHQLLVKMHPDHRGLAHAAILMTGHSTTNNRSENKAYGWLKRKHVQIVSELGKERFKCPVYREKILQNLAKGRKTRWDDPERAEQIRKNSKERWDLGHGEKMNEAAKEYWSDAENRRKASKRVSGKNNPNYGTHWYHHPETLDSLRCKPDEIPEGYVRGKKPKKPNTKCVTCGVDTGSIRAKWCDEHRQKNHKRKNLSNETKQKISTKHKGKKHSDSTKQKISTSLIGKTKKVSTKEKMRTAQLGTKWINDGSNNKRLAKNSPLPDGWNYGRI